MMFKMYREYDECRVNYLISSCQPCLHFSSLNYINKLYCSNNIINIWSIN